MDQIRRGQKKGFSLIELLIVLVVLAVLATFAIPRYNRMVLKTKMMKRLPVLEALRKGQVLYRLENTDFFRDINWIEPGDPNTAAVEAALRVVIPGISDYQGQNSSFVAFEKFPDDATSAWWVGDARFDAASCPYRIYASQGHESSGDACIIMCCDEGLNVKRTSIKYKTSSLATAPVDDL